MAKVYAGQGAPGAGGMPGGMPDMGGAGPTATEEQDLDID